MEILRTHEDRFENLPNFPYEAKYEEDLNGFEKLRLHYIDEGKKDAKYTFLCLHGQPTWAYLYRKMIPIFLKYKHRVIAPDFFGFGKSDKPVDENTYTFNFHRETLKSFITNLDLTNIILVCQDWGGILGLTLPMEMKERFTHLIVLNTTLGTGDYEMTKGFLDFKEWVNNNPDLDAGRLICRASPILSEEECVAYSAPFPTTKFKAGVRRFPNIVPLNRNDEGAKISRKARTFLKNKWTGKTFMAIGMKDPVLGPPIMTRLRNNIKNCPEPLKISDAGHFVQEWGDIVANEALKYFELD
ncbi:MAG: alpha/beta fold hydrolase [Candidatus Lokiarchaeota archaeon]|nr:alpha/beta fold hydrolase [Candidatus Lokiarchaeota archaeon]